TITYSELNQGALNGLRQAQFDLARARDVNAVVDARNRIAQNQMNLYTVKTTHRDVSIETAENVQVRMAQPKAAFDDMRNIKTYTGKELAALRGTDRLFDAEFGDLATGQVVRVTLVRPKTPPPARPKGKDEVNLDDYKLLASRIVILSQGVPK